MLADTHEIQVESKAEFWRRHIENCSRSPLTQGQYCREHSLALSTFGYWKKRLRMPSQPSVRFYPLTVQSVQKTNTASSTAGLSLYFCNDKFRIELAENFSAACLQKLITTLEQL